MKKFLLFIIRSLVLANIMILSAFIGIMSVSVLNPYINNKIKLVTIAFVITSAISMIMNNIVDTYMR